MTRRGQVQVDLVQVCLASCTTAITESRVTCLEKEIPKVKFYQVHTGSADEIDMTCSASPRVEGEHGVEYGVKEVDHGYGRLDSGGGVDYSESGRPGWRIGKSVGDRTTSGLAPPWMSIEG